MQGKVDEVYLLNGLRVVPNRFDPRQGGYLVGTSWIVENRAANLEWGVKTLEAVKAHMNDNAKWEVILWVGGSEKDLNTYEEWFRLRLEVGKWKGSYKGRKALATAKTLSWCVFILPRR